MDLQRDPDRVSCDELTEMIRDARDKAHWLAVHRRFPLAGHIENLLDAVFRMAVALRGDATRRAIKRQESGQ